MMILRITALFLATALSGCVGVPSADKEWTPSQKSVVEVDLQVLDYAISRFKLDTGSLPRDLSQLVERGDLQVWSGPYLKDRSMLKDPWGHSYIYGVTRSGYFLQSVGPDGDANSLDDLVNLFH